MMRGIGTTRSRLALGIVLSAAIGIGLASTAAGGDGLAAEARAATARYHSITQADAAGYGPFPAGVPLHECIMALDSSGGMGIHWVNGSLLDTALDERAPEVLVYAPRGNGSLELVALEYVVFAEPWAQAHGSTTPTVFGEDLTLVPAPNRYEIPAFWQRHIWLYEDNEAGLFADFNPAVTC
jgi:hypothetical protein